MGSQTRNAGRAGAAGLTARPPHNVKEVRSTQEALERLLRGNQRFVENGSAGAVGLAPRQRPFAAVLGCSDARVPTEMVLDQACNDLFVVRVAGNVLSSEGLGSLDYAAQQFEDSLKLLLVLGHSGCGAVTAAVDAFLRPTRYLSLAASQPLRAIIDRLFIAVRGAARALRGVHGDEVTQQPGYREALIEMAVVANAAISAFSLRQELAAHHVSQIGVVYGVYDLASHRLIVPGLDHGERVGFSEPPANESDFAALGRRTAMSSRILRILGE